MSDTVLAIEQFLEEAGFYARAEERAEKRAEERKALTIAQKLIARGDSLEEVAAITQLDIEKVKAVMR